MPNEYIIGIDGGGTKTHCALYDTYGNLKDFIEFGPTNHEALPGGFDDMKIELHKLLSITLERNDIGVQNLKYSVFGMAGVDTKKQHAVVSEIIRDYGIDKFTLCNDSYLGVKAGCTNGVGICAINGTGFSVTGIDSKGKMMQVGGIGYLTADKGGGSYLFEIAVGCVYSSLFKDTESTVMKEMMFDILDINSKEDFIDKVTEKLQTNSKDFMLKINRLVYEAANKKDQIAIKILKDIGVEYARAIGGVLRELEFTSTDHIEIILAGSQFTKGANATSINMLKEAIIAEYQDRNIEFKILEEPCVIGAVLWALECANKTTDLRDKVIREYHSSICNGHNNTMKDIHMR